MLATSCELPCELVERVLSRLGLDKAPAVNFHGLSAVYGAWCRHVPFDNLRKLVHLAARDTRPFPGDSPTDFFEAWLKYGSGGTCWAGNGALAALLQSLGFNISRGISTMMVAPALPPNHGTVVVTIKGDQYLVDASILHVEPLLLHAERVTSVDHPVWGVTCTPRDGKWHVLWHSTHMAEPFECRINYLGASAGEFSDFYEGTRGWSPFNYSVYARRLRGREMIGIAYGERVVVDASGNRRSNPISREDCLRSLVEEFGIHEELVVQLPLDQPMPPPPRPGDGIT